MRTSCNKNRVSFTLGVTNTHINIRVLYLILVVSTVHSIVKRKVTVFLQYFRHNVLHSSCCGGHCSLLPVFSTKELVDFFIVILHFALTACNPWCYYTSNCSNKRCACSNRRRIYKRKKIGSLFFSRNCGLAVCSINGCSIKRFPLYMV